MVACQVNITTYPTPLHPANPPLPTAQGNIQHALPDEPVTNLFIKVRKEKLFPIIGCYCFVLEMFNMCTKVLIKYLYK